MEGRIDPDKVRAKFGGDFVADRILYIMGIDIRLAGRIASRFAGRTVLETCTGGGFSTIALAREARHVYTVDVDPYHHQAAKGNVEKAGVKEKVTFISGDALDDDLLEKAVEDGIMPVEDRIDAAFLDPDWAVTGDDHVYRFRNSNTRPPADRLLEKVQDITPNIVLILPPFIDVGELDGLPPHELQQMYLDGSLALLVLCFGELMATEGDTEIHVTD